MAPSPAPVPSVFTIPVGVPFARALAGGLLQETASDPLALAHYHLLLPTRRACRTLQDAFLQLSAGKPLILPRLQPLADVAEDELLLHNPGAPELPLPPPVGEQTRQIMLARLIMKRPDFTQGFPEALVLARQLGQFLDEIHTENCRLEDLPELVQAAGGYGGGYQDLAQHWQVTVRFLEILSSAWPALLQEAGMTDKALHRNRLLEIQAALWQESPPPHPVVAAGITGSIPAAAALLRVVADMPGGRVVLPGLDRDLDEDGWNAVDPPHPQYALKGLLAVLGRERDAVAPWPAAQHEETPAARVRRRLATALMRPAAVSQDWGAIPPDSPPDAAALLQQNLWRFEAENPEEEAFLIALLLRQALETPGRTAALVTPDRGLARRVKALCGRWRINLDDSGGESLADSQPGTFLRALAAALQHDLAPVALLALLRHPLARAGRDAVDLLDRHFLRGTRPPPGLRGLALRLDDEGRPGAPPVPPAARQAARALVAELARDLAPLFTEDAGEEDDTGRRLERFLAAAEALAGGPERLWQGDAGAGAAALLAALRAESGLLPPLGRADFAALLTHMLQQTPLRARSNPGTRIFILGQFESRLFQADTMILGGLNEGIWPADPGHDPWLSRPLRAAFGLPAPEARIGQAAHDFVQAFCAPHVVLTRSRRIGGKPALPSRWLQRLEAVLQARGWPVALPPEARALQQAARRYDQAVAPQAFPRPGPAPVAVRRPRTLPVTQIEALQANPYGVYARYVLDLRRLDPLEQVPDARVRGEFIHDILHEFITHHKGHLPENAEQILVDIGSVHRQRLSDDAALWDFWWPRFLRLARAYVPAEREWRTQAEVGLLEVGGKTEFSGPAGTFTLTARADRLDRLRTGGWAVIDYKSAGTYSLKAMKSGDLPQLPLEGLILRRAGFSGMEAGKADAAYLGYWKLTGGREEVETCAITDEDARAAVDRAAEGLARLVAAFQDPATPFWARPDPARVPRFDDYEHLARVQEWATAEADAGGEEAA